ncbi:MAG: RluA family pseudouridine synthase [Clostridia bacterium]|nr:RluA family pseudouridine synthase [Clostridia bacterium]
MKKIIIKENDADQRADKFIQKAFPSLPKTLMYKAFRKKDIKVNGKWIKENVFLQEGDTLTIYLPDDCFSEKTFTPVNDNISVIYEDENIIIIDKEKGVPCQAGQDGKTPLCDMLKSYLYNKKEFIPQEEQSFSPALCNRIDTNTEGLVIGAKNAMALRDMNEAIRNRQIGKFYLCETEGIPPKKEDEVILYLTKDKSKNKMYVTKDGEKTVTAYRIIEKTSTGARVEIDLKTGKSHQIRAVMAHLNCPLKGDGKYGATTKGGQKLISYKLTFAITTPLLSYLNEKIFYSKHAL